MKPLIGWREWVALPELGVRWIKAKVDTGARSSSLHAYDVETFRRRGVDMVRFKVHPLQRDTGKTITAEAPLIDQRWVRSSSGHQTLRPVIHTPIELTGEQWVIELTLGNRDNMGFRMLLGRQALRGWLVDPARSYLAGKRPRRKAGRTAGGKSTTTSKTKSKAKTKTTQPGTARHRRTKSKGSL